MGSPMRTLGFRTHVLLAKTEDETGIGDIHGPLNAFFDGVERWATSSDGVAGWQALDHWGQIVAAMAAVAVLGSIACLVPSLQGLGRDLARYGSLAAPAILA